MTRFVRRVWLAAVLLVLILALYAFGPRLIIGAPVSGRVVDADGKRPIAGAYVVAAWALSRSTLAGLVSAGTFKVVETTTAADGTYEIERWRKWLMAFNGHVDNRESPKLLVFKNGYQPAVFSNEVWPPGATHESAFHSWNVFRSSWNGKDLRLGLIGTTAPRYAVTRDEFSFQIATVTSKADAQGLAAAFERSDVARPPESN